MKKEYKVALQHLSDAELAEAYVFPSNLSEEERHAANLEIREVRLQKLREMTAQQRLHSELLRLKFQMEDYFQRDTYDEMHSFPVYLKAYITILNKKQKDFAEEVDLHQTKLNQLLTGKTAANFSLFYRLEKHSGGILKANYWWKLCAKKIEFDLKTNNADRQKEGARVKNELVFA